MEKNDVIKVGVVAGGALAAYQFAYKPWKIRHEMEEATKRATAEGMAKGMSFADAHAAAVSTACRAVGAFYKIPPDKSKGVCDGIGKLVTMATILGTKLSIKATKAVAKGVAKGVVAAGKGVATGAKGVASAVKFVSYTAPKKVTVAAAKGVAKGATAAGKGTVSAVKFASYTAPKKVTVASAKAVGKGATGVAKAVKVVSYTAPKKVVTSVGKALHLFGVDEGLGDDAATIAYMSGIGAQRHAAGMERAIRGARTNPLARASSFTQAGPKRGSRVSGRPARQRPAGALSVRRPRPADVYLRYFG